MPTQTRNAPAALLRILTTGLCLLAATGVLQAQRTVAAKPSDNDWKLGTTVAGVQCFYRIAQCADKKVVFLKFNNANPATVTLSWQETFSVQEGQTVRALAAGGERRMAFPGGETAVGACDATANRELISQPPQTTPVYTADVRAFAFKNVKVVN